MRLGLLLVLLTTAHLSCAEPPPLEPQKIKEMALISGALFTCSAKPSVDTAGQKHFQFLSADLNEQISSYLIAEYRSIAVLDMHVGARTERAGELDELRSKLKLLEAKGFEGIRSGKITCVHAAQFAVELDGRD